MEVDQNVSMTACRSVTLNIHKFSDISALTSTKQHTIHHQFSIEPLWSVGVRLHFMCSFSLRKLWLRCIAFRDLNFAITNCMAGYIMIIL